MKKLFLFIILFTSFHFIQAQQTDTKKDKRDERREEKRKKINELIRQDEEGILVYSKQTIFGFQLRTKGYGLFLEKGKMKSQRSTNIYRLDFTETKHSKEDKLPNGGFSFGNPYIYGKINNFYQFHLGFGQQRILGQKGNKNGVAVSVVYSGGLLAGMLRPYYVDVDDNGLIKTIKFTPQDSVLFLTGFIIGSAGIGEGWKEIKFKPGVFAKTALRFDYGRFNEVVSGVEIGLSAEYYTDKIPQMVFQKNKQFFLQGHVSIMFGHRK